MKRAGPVSCCAIYPGLTETQNVKNRRCVRGWWHTKSAEWHGWDTLLRVSVGSERLIRHCTCTNKPEGFHRRNVAEYINLAWSCHYFTQIIKNISHLHQRFLTMQKRCLCARFFETQTGLKNRVGSCCTRSLATTTHAAVGQVQHGLLPVCGHFPCCEQSAIESSQWQAHFTSEGLSTTSWYCGQIPSAANNTGCWNTCLWTLLRTAFLLEIYHHL